jgi:hypothetical protein
MIVFCPNSGTSLCLGTFASSLPSIPDRVTVTMFSKMQVNNQPLLIGLLPDLIQVCRGIFLSISCLLRAHNLRISMFTNFLESPTERMNFLKASMVSPLLKRPKVMRLLFIKWTYLGWWGIEGRSTRRHSHCQRTTGAFSWTLQ